MSDIPNKNPFPENDDDSESSLDIFAFSEFSYALRKAEELVAGIGSQTSPEELRAATAMYLSSSGRGSFAMALRKVMDVHGEAGFSVSIGASGKLQTNFPADPDSAFKPTEVYHSTYTEQLLVDLDGVHERLSMPVLTLHKHPSAFAPINLFPSRADLRSATNLRYELGEGSLLLPGLDFMVAPYLSRFVVWAYQAQRPEAFKHISEVYSQYQFESEGELELLVDDLSSIGFRAFFIRTDRVPVLDTPSKTYTKQTEVISKAMLELLPQFDLDFGLRK